MAEADPYRLAAGGELPVRLLYEDKPLAGALVVAIPAADPAAAQSARSDRGGRATFRLDQPGPLADQGGAHDPGAGGFRRRLGELLGVVDVRAAVGLSWGHQRPPLRRAIPVNDDQRREVHLLGRVAAGDGEAFAELFDRQSPLVLGALIRVLRSRAEAEEVLQEVFLQVWRDARRYVPERASPRGWLLMLARSRALDRLRSRQSREQREEAVAGGGGGAVAAPVGSARLEAEDRRRQVQAALGGLPDEQRRCIELAFFDGLTHTEIATRLAAPLGTVKSRVLLGMRKLRQALAAT